ncbi:MAG: carbohydrate-binding domain-containing protein [Ruminococcus sp.]|nr:carbohydrate-binding domain-containing protein [Ruminococcus sp.]
MKKSYARKTAAGIMSLALLSSMITMPTASAALAGDTNNDGAVGVADIVSLQKHLLKVNNLSGAGRTNADLNSDGRINVFDIAILKGMVSNPVTDIIKIHLSDSGITVEGDNKGVVSINGKIATITASGNYIVDGSITDGQILVNIPDITVDANAVEMELNNVTMTNSTMPCIYSQSTDKLKINVTGTNTLTDTAAAAYTGMDGCIYALTDLTITKNSTGTLNVTSSMNKGIYSDKDLKLNGGTINVVTDVDDLSDADALVGDNTLSVDGATITVDSSADGLKSKGENVEIVSGDIEVKAGNDAVQAATSIDISGGTVVAGGDRGFRLDDAGLLNITGGDIIATATDYQITDATLSAATINMTGSTQTVLFLDYAAEQVKDQAVTLKQGGNTVYEMTANKKFSYVIASSASLSSNATYNLYTGGVQQGHTNGTAADFAVTANGAEFTAISALGGAVVTPTDDTVATKIVYSGDTATAYNAAGTVLTSASNLTVSGATVNITVPSILDVSGSSTSAQIIVDCDKTTYATGVCELDLTGADLSNSTAAPIYVKQIGDECQIVAKSGSVNTISDGTSHTDTNSAGEVINGAIYAEDDLKIKGQGTLTVNGNYQDGVVCKNDLKVFNGTINVNAVDDCLRGNDSVTIGNETDTDFSTLNVTVNSSAGDGIKTNETVASEGEGAIIVNGGTVNVTSNSDGLHGSMAVTINGGDLNIKTNGSSTTTTDVSSKGIKAGCTDDAGTAITGTITINGGHIITDTTDDSIHASGNISLLGGEMEINSGDDAVHSDADVIIGDSTADDYNDVKVVVYSGYEGIEGLNITMNSGTVVSTTTDDGFNAAGGADGSGTTSPGGWGSMAPGSSSSSGSYSLNLKGGFALVSTASGDHDGFDSNGALNITGGIHVTNGQDAFDCDGTMSYTGGVYVKNVGSQMGGMGGSSSMTESVNVSTSVSAGTRVTLCDGSGNIIVSFIADKTCSSLVAGCTSYSGAAFYTGGTLNGSTYFQEYDQTQLAAYGGTLSGGTAVSGSSSGNQWGW